jgi:hypothetical protein
MRVSVGDILEYEMRRVIGGPDRPRFSLSTDRRVGLLPRAWSQGKVIWVDRDRCRVTDLNGGFSWNFYLSVLEHESFRMCTGPSFPPKEVADISALPHEERVKVLSHFCHTCFKLNPCKC